MSPHKPWTSRSPKRNSPRSSGNDGRNNSRSTLLLRRTKKLLDLRSAFRPKSISKVKRTKRVFDLRGAFASLLNTSDSTSRKDRSSSSKRSSSGSTSAYVGLYDPMPDKVQLTMYIDLEFLFCVNRILIADKNHFLWPLHNKQPEKGLDQLKRIFSSNEMTINEALNPVDIDIGNWNLTPFVVAEYFDSKEACAKVLTSTGRMTLDTISQWDLTGARLISRELTAPDCDAWGRSIMQTRRADKSLLEINDYLKALTEAETPTSPYFVLTRPDVTHVGISIGTGVDEKPLKQHLDMLKHLALILVEHEDIISLLHHPDRRGWTDARANTRSRRYGAKDNTHICGTLSVDSILSIEADIFGCRDIHTLASLMEAEYEDTPHVKFIDWTSLADFGRLTFFQHAGSKDVLEVGYWIRFIVTLFRLAERRSFGIPPPHRPAGLDIDMRIGEVNRLWVFEAQERRADELFTVLGLGRSDRKYWQGRMHEYAKAEYLYRYQTSGFENCPACETVISEPEQQAPSLPNTPRVQRQLQQEIEQLLTQTNTPTTTSTPSAPPPTLAEVDALSAEHVALGEEIASFTQALGLVPSKYADAGAGGLVRQSFELAHDYVALESQIAILEARMSTLVGEDVDAAADTALTLRANRMLRRELEEFLASQRDVGSLGEHRLVREVHELSVSHARVGAAIDTMRRQVIALPLPSPTPTPSVGRGAGVRGPRGRPETETWDSNPQAGPHMRALAQELLGKMQGMRANHMAMEEGLRRARTMLAGWEDDERNEREREKGEANGKELKRLAAEVLLWERSTTMFDSGGPKRRGYPMYDDGNSTSSSGGGSGRRPRRIMGLP